MKRKRLGDGRQANGDDESRVDVAVLGGGPAGAAAARMLAGLGHETTLVFEAPSGGPRVCESLPPSCRKPLAALGLLEAVERSGFLVSHGNTVAWAGEGARSAGFEGGEIGWQVERGRFDRVLREAAGDAGVRLVAGAVRRIAVTGGDGEEAVIDWQREDGAGTVRARWLLDCTGRAGILARRGHRVRQPGPATLALVRAWRGSRSEVLPDPSHTFVESYETGWAWSVPQDERIRHVAVMVDPRVSRLARGAGLERVYAGELAKTTHHRELIARAGPVGEVWACTATPYSATRYAGRGYLLVGDAGSFLDPLSSFGVKKALASAWLASVVVNTSLRTPSMTEAAAELYDSREREVHGRYAALSAEYYRRAAHHHEHAFWTSRANPGTSSSVDEQVEIDAGAALRHPAVPAAFERLRSMPKHRLRSAPDVRRKWLPIVRNHEIVVEEHLISTALPGGIRSVRGVGLTGILDLLPNSDEIPELYEEVRRSQGHVELPDFLGALAVLLALGMVVETED